MRAAAAMYAPPRAERPINAFDIGHLVKADEPDVWPENWPAVKLFAKLDTQWRVVSLGMSGRVLATGLDYGAVYPLLDHMQLDPAQWDEMLADVRTLEAAALDEMRKQLQ